MDKEVTALTDDIYVYPANLPIGVKEIVAPCLDGYTVYVNDRYTFETRVGSYLHAVGHIEGNDWEKSDVQSIEAEAHERRN